MRFFKYLFLFFISSYAYADANYLYGVGGDARFETQDQACKSYGPNYNFVPKSGLSGNRVGSCVDSWGSNTWLYAYAKPVSCPVSGYPILTWFNYGNSVPLQTCKLNADGSYCIAKYAGTKKPLVTNYPNYQLVLLESVSAIPSSSCTPKSDKPCDPKDPYGGCYTPPNDNCTRLADGSITCPEDTPTPEPDNACTGGTYCIRPPEGCGEGYVSGSFNGEALCVKSGPSSPPNSDEGGGASEPTGNNSNTSTSTSTSTSSSSSGDGGNGGGTNVNNTINVINNTTVNVDTSGIIGAINNVKNSLNVAITDLNKSVKSVTSTLTGTNEKLDTVNNTLDSINQNTQTTNDKLDQLINKPSGTGEGFDDTGIIAAIGGISDKLTDYFGTERDTTQLEQLGTPSNDSRYINAQSGAESSLNSLSNKLTFSSSACIPDLTINDVPMFGSVTIPLSHYCDLLALVKIFLHLATLFAALRIVESSVRAI